MKSRFVRRTSLLLTTGALALSLAACGSDDDTTNAPAQPDGKPARKGYGKGDFKPDKKAPDTAGDRKPDAPDRDISKRPGGPEDPASP